MMRDAIENFHTQFAYKPRIENAKFLKKRERFVVVGMGGSHLAADLLQAWLPDLLLTIHADYGLPKEVSDDSLVIINSYSGNTEESLDVFEKALEARLPLLAIGTNGKLIELAMANSVPYIQMPDTGIQPRSALGFTLMALLYATGQEDVMKEAAALAESLVPSKYEDAGKNLAKNLQGKTPVIYSSARNFALAYIWKIKFNETAKIPAFANVFPELNHNEMTGFDAQDSTRKLAENFCFLFLEDGEDDPRIARRMKITRLLLERRGLKVFPMPLAGQSRIERIFSSVLLADWAVLHTAGFYGVDPEQIPMVEELKRLMA